MTGREKVAAAREYLKERGVKPHVAAPPWWRLLWAAGLPVPPPLFLGFVPLVLLNGLVFGCFLALAGLGMILLTGGPLAWPAAWMGAVGGTVFGLINAGHARWMARRHGVPLWRDFDPLADPDDSW